MFCDKEAAKISYLCLLDFEGAPTLFKWASDEGIPAEVPAAEGASSTSEVENSISEIKKTTSEVEKTTPPAGETPHSTAADASEILTPQTKLSALFECYPELRNRMTEISPLFAMLKTPFGKLMAKKADLQAVSDGSGVAFDRLVSEMQHIITRPAYRILWRNRHSRTRRARTESVRIRLRLPHRRSHQKSASAAKSHPRATGRASGVKKAQISRLERGYSITIPTMSRVFKALGIHTATLDLGIGGKVALW